MNDQPSEGESLASSRSRRQKVDKHGRLAALEKFKGLKGTKRKYEMEEEFKPVYDIVDEKEYSKHVQQRQEEDWIVDDDGSGYVEDGREVFDDIEESGPSSSAKSKRNKYKTSDVTKKQKVKANSIKSMFMAAPPSKKKSDKEAKLEDDDLLGDIMEELKNEPATKKKSTPASQPRKRVNPFKTMPQATTPVRPSHVKSISPRVMDYEPKIEEVDSQDVQAADLVDIEEEKEVKEAAKPSIEDMWGDDMPDSAYSEIPDEALGQAMKTEDDKKLPASSLETEEVEWHGPEECKNQTTSCDVNVDSSKSFMTKNEDGEQVLKFYWLDAYEDFKRQNGTVYLFGKVYIEAAKTHVSCCIRVENINRRIFLLPRATKRTGNQCTDEPVAIKDVYNEFNEKVANKYNIKLFKCKETSKQYAFNIPDVPEESDYLEVQYSAQYPILPVDTCGDTFSRVFGTNTSSLESFLLDRKMKGPCWLEVKCPEMPKSSFSWCRVEAVVHKPNSVSVMQTNAPAPPLVVMTVSMPTVVNPKTMQCEFVAVSCLVHEQFPIDKPPPSPPYQVHFCALTKPVDAIFPYDFAKVLQSQKTTKIEKIESERALLGYFLVRIQKHDPDIIIGHDIVGFDLDVLIRRLDVRKVPHWSKIGRLKRSSIPKLPPSSRMQQIERDLMAGRLICDVKISARELIRSKSYDLTTLVDQVLHKNRIEIAANQVKDMYSSSKSLMQLVCSSMLDAEYILTIMCELNVLPLALQITNIAGNLLGRTLLGGRSERNEYLLLHAFHAKNFICPDKTFKAAKNRSAENEEDESANALSSKEKGGKKKPSYSGGLVLDPKKGFYDTFILLMDFNSLYPSIIQEYNICFTTIPQIGTSENGEDEIPDIPDASLEAGILPTEIRKLVESRRQVKSLMKSSDISPEQRIQYDIRQKALKLTANSMYGCLGFSHSRFYAKPLAALVTSRGREILLHTKDLVQSMNLDVIYGDTDSIMINTLSRDMEEVFKLGNKVKAEINRAYRCLEIDIDGVFKSMLLLKKKKYAALTIQEGPKGQLKTSKELKGLDIVRRDWSELAKDAGEYVVTEILSDKARETIIENIQSHLINLSSSIADFPLDKFSITKQLTKDPSEYPDKKSLSHVIVALRLNTKGGKKLRRGDTVSYIICEDGSSSPATQRAYHAEEMKANPDLKIDFKYYLSQQVHPVVSRLCDPIEGTDAAAIAEFLGLDPSGYRHVTKHNDDDMMTGSDHVPEEERYRDCEKFVISCPECKTELEVGSIFTGSGAELRPLLSRCSNAQCTWSPLAFANMLCNRLTLAIRQHINKYYQAWLVCEDSSCGARTRNLPLRFTRSGPVCQRCQAATVHREYTDYQLYNQLRSYQYTFDVKKQTEKLNELEKSVARRTGDQYLACYRQLKQTVDQVLARSAYSIVNLTKLFDGFMKVSGTNSMK